MFAYQTLFDYTHTRAAELLSGLDLPWLALPKLKAYIDALCENAPADFEEIAPRVFAAKDARIAGNATLAGPCLIGHEAEIRPCAYIRGAALIGDGAVVGNSTELKNCVLFDCVQVPHFNYIGDSILGYKAHFGAGSVTSNVRSDKANIVVHDPDGELHTGLRKMGAMVGDFVEIGCNAVLNPGVVIGPHAMVYPTSCVRGVLPAYTIWKTDGSTALRKER